MASTNMPSKRNKKSNPTVLRVSYEVPAGGATQFIDSGLGLSILNRKFLRAGLYYYINSIEIYNNERGVVDIFTAPDNWCTRNAHTRGEAIWDKMNDLVEPPLSAGTLPAYHDFKVYLTELHRTTGSLRPSLYDVNGAQGVYTADDWVYSVFTSADDDQTPNVGAGPFADEFTCHLLGQHTGSSANWNSIGLIESYENSRGRVPDTSPTTAGADLAIDPLINIFDFSSEEQMNDILTNLEEDNDAPPYNADRMVGSQGPNNMHHVARVGTEVGLGRVGRAAGFCAPFGLICIDPHPISEGVNLSSFRVVVNYAAGSYKGVYAERA